MQKGLNDVCQRFYPFDKNQEVEDTHNMPPDRPYGGTQCSRLSQLVLSLPFHFLHFVQFIDLSVKYDSMLSLHFDIAPLPGF